MLGARYPGIGLLALSVDRDPGPALAPFRHGVTGLTDAGGHIQPSELVQSDARADGVRRKA